MSVVSIANLASPWLLFESGFGAANPACDVIPVGVGIDTPRDLPGPLAIYQAYQLADFESLRAFAAKLLARFRITLRSRADKVQLPKESVAVPLDAPD